MEDDYKIVVKHSHIEVNDYDIGDSIKVERSLSKWKWEYIAIAFAYSKIDRILYVPRGIDISFLEREFDTVAHYDMYNNHFDQVDFFMKNPPLDDMQRKVISYLAGKGSFEYTYKKSQLMVDLMTGKGKTYCTLAAISLHKSRSAIFCHDEDKIKEWKDDILEHTYVEESDIYIIQGKKSILKMLKPGFKLPKIYLISHRTLSTYSKTDAELLTELFVKMRIGIKVFDEAHKEFYSMIKIDLFTNTKRTFYLTASPDRSDHLESAVYKLYFKNVIFYGNADLITSDDIYAIGVFINMDTKPSIVDITNCQTKQGFSAPTYSKQIFSGKPRDTIINTLKKAFEIAESNVDPRIAIYITSIDAIDTMKLWLIEDFGIDESDIGRYHSKVPKAEKERAKNECKYILTTISSLGTGKNIPGLTTIIDTEAFSSNNTARQLPGRLRNIKGKKLYYIKLVNTGYRKFMNQVKSVKPVFKKVLKTIYYLKDD